MRSIKTIGLITLAALATMAFIGAGSASAVTDIVLCKKKSEAVCSPESNTWEEGKGITALAIGVKFKAGATTVECKHSKIVGATSEQFGNPELKMSIKTAELSECGAACTPTIEGLTQAKFAVAEIDNYSLKLNFKLKLVCAGVTCVYSGNGTSIDLDNHDEGFPLAAASEKLLTLEPSQPKGCATLVEWFGCYELIGGDLTINLSLYNLP